MPIYGCLQGKSPLNIWGGPVIYWKSGRVDYVDDRCVPEVGRLPFADKDAGHIRTTFTRLGFNDQQTVVLVGAHGVGRCHKKFSGWDGKWTHDPLVFDNEFYKVLLSETWSQDVVPETGKVQYYNGDRSLIMLNTDMELIRDSRYRQWVEVYAKNKERFLNDFAAAFSKLLELGVKRSCE